MSRLPFHVAFPVRDLASTRAQGEPSERATMFLLDPSGNALEPTAFRNPDAVYAR
ncbi:MAG TPA: hypothetical protein VFD38_06005 [Myxococcaceae bacterium]|nr:hypothetical protein [Myxococcaceae bacterium]